MLLETFQNFMDDREAGEMFVTGPAGTGKTTSLKELVEYCTARKIRCVTCAYTHKAVSVLAKKLPTPGEFSSIRTLHSYLKKRPTINGAALKLAHVEGNAQVDIPEKVDVIFVDEFSMVGEQDYMSLVDTQYDEDGIITTKVVYIGDLNQLPPVKDIQSINPKKPYWVKLTTIYRQKDDNPLIDTLMSLNDYINGKPTEKLAEHATFIRGQDIADLYKKSSSEKIILAYTNERVENLNAQIQGRRDPELDDLVYSPTTRKHYRLEAMGDEIGAIVALNNELIPLQSKYKTLETLHKMQVKFMTLLDLQDDTEMPRAVVFGHHAYLVMKTELANTAVAANKAIEAKYGLDSKELKEWAKANWQDPLAKDRANAWKHFLAFKDCVLCVDFPHAMTVHKSQGSTYEEVYLDTEDMGKCANSDYQLYLKLLYVAISRASRQVFTN